MVIFSSSTARARIHVARGKFLHHCKHFDLKPASVLLTTFSSCPRKQDGMCGYLRKLYGKRTHPRCNSELHSDSKPAISTRFRPPNNRLSSTKQDGMCGYLLKLYGKGTHRVWRKKWFYLMEDRLCYTEDEDTLGPIKYLPLDRIPVRPYPRGYKPDIGVSILTGNML